MTYADFLAGKQRAHGSSGVYVTAGEVSPLLHEWQREGVAWAVGKGRAALWWSTGLGKTRAQLEWARLTCEHRGGHGLIVAPLAVCEQTVREAVKIGVEATYVRDPALAPDTGLWVTNYEMIEHFDPSRLTAVVLDEASILKQSDGRTRTRLIKHFAAVPSRLACTATPAPNDPEELTNQAEFLGVMPRAEMLASFFVNDQKTKGYRLKGHAKLPLYRWLSTWAMALRMPSDIGGDDTGYLLPELHIVPEIVHVDMEPQDGQLFRTGLGGVTGRAEVRRETLDARVSRAVELVKAEPDEPWILWTHLNTEASALAAAIPGAVNVLGSWTPEEKAAAYMGFVDGDIRYLITKGSMSALGLNFQHCARQIFVGMNDSWELWFQAIRRSWRFGQTREVYVHAVLSQLEAEIAANVQRKGRQADVLVDGMVTAMRQRWAAQR